MIIVSPFAAFVLARRKLHPILAAQERQKQFISNASHELRTPLAILFGELELALKKERTIEEYKSTLQNSKEEAGRLIELTNQLLLLSRLDEKTTLPQQSVDISSVLKESIQKNASLQKQKHLKIDLHLASKTLLVKADPELLLIMISNLIDNAAKYSPPQETIKLWVEDHSSFARITISNIGVTLSEQEVRTVFKRFNRAKSPKSEGFGLGLAIAKAIVDAHRGQIRLLIDKHTTKVEVDLPYSK